MPHTPAQRSLIGKIGIESRLRSEDRQEMTQAARQRSTFGRFYDQTDPALPHDERVRLAESMSREHMARMALASVAARRARAQGAGK